MRAGFKQSQQMKAWQLKSLWWKQTWWFQFAHKPLCDRFHRETFRLGKLRVCRSCTLLYSALAISLGLLATVSWPPISFALFSISFTAVLVASHPKAYRFWPRELRDCFRAGFGFLLPLTLFTAWKVHWFLPFALAGILWGVWSWYSRVRAERKPQKCEHCPELAEGGVCSGYQQQTDSIRAYEEAATELVYLQFTPPTPSKRFNKETR